MAQRATPLYQNAPQFHFETRGRAPFLLVTQAVAWRLRAGHARPASRRTRVARAQSQSDGLGDQKRLARFARRRPATIPLPRSVDISRLLKEGFRGGSEGVPRGFLEGS